MFLDQFRPGIERDVRRVVREVEKEGARFVFVDPASGFGGQFIFAFPALNRARLGVRVSGEVVIEALLLRPKPRAAEMPFPEARRRVSGTAQDFGERRFFQRELTFDDRLPELLRRSIRATGKEIREMQTSGAFTREDRRARRRADGLRAIRGREAHALPSELIEIRRGLILPTVATQVIDPEIVGEDENDVWLFIRCENAAAQQREEKTERGEEAKEFHGWK